jgi:hypothetical protein
MIIRKCLVLALGLATNRRRAPSRPAVPFIAAILALGLTLVLASYAEARIYWAGTGRIGAAALDGSGVDQLFIAPSYEGPSGAVAVDGEHLYWSRTFSCGFAGCTTASSIGRANLDGTGVDPNFVSRSPAAYPLPFGLAVDAAHLYWADFEKATIGRANLDGTGVDPSFISFAGTPYPPGFAIAVDGAHLYWTGTNTIGRANLDGSGVDQSFISGLDYPLGLAVDALPDVPPNTYIDSSLESPTINNLPTFSFSSNDSGASFECQLDGGGYAACSSPYATGPLPDGPHKFEVRAVDGAEEKDPTPASSEFSIDTSLPSSAASSAAFSNSTSITVDYSAADTGSGLRGSIELWAKAPGEGSYAIVANDFLWFPTPSASGSFNYVAAKGDGTYSFYTRARDYAGNYEAAPGSPDSATLLDTIAPHTHILSGPAGLTNVDTPSFAFSSEAGANFECRLDGGGYAACASPFATGPLPDGFHTFKVRATDEASNTGSPATRSFTVDTAPPGTQIDSGPAGPTNDATPTFAFSSEAGASFECSLDDGGYSACSSPLNPGQLPDGPHSFEVRARDQAGNVDPSPASSSFVVDTQPQTKLFGKRQQAAGKTIAVKVSCAEDCVVAANGKVLVWGGPRRHATGHAARRRKTRFGLRKATRQLSAGQVATLKLRPKGKKTWRRLRRLLRRGMRAGAAIRVRYWDRAGNSRTAKLRIGLRRG